VDPDINFTVIDVSSSSDVDISAYRGDRANIELLLQEKIMATPLLRLQALLDGQ